MRRSDIKNLGLRISLEDHDKMVYIAEYEGRTLNGQVRFLIQKCIREFEKEYGSITREALEELNKVSRS